MVDGLFNPWWVPRAPEVVPEAPVLSVPEPEAPTPPVPETAPASQPNEKWLIEVQKGGAFKIDSLLDDARGLVTNAETNSGAVGRSACPQGQR